jgi:hypothetical protein
LSQLLLFLEQTLLLDQHLLLGRQRLLQRSLLLYELILLVSHHILMLLLLKKERLLMLPLLLQYQIGMLSELRCHIHDRVMVKWHGGRGHVDRGVSGRFDDETNEVFSSLHFILSFHLRLLLHLDTVVSHFVLL